MYVFYALIFLSIRRSLVRARVEEPTQKALNFSVLFLFWRSILSSTESFADLLSMPRLSQFDVLSFEPLAQIEYGLVRRKHGPKRLHCPAYRR